MSDTRMEIRVSEEEKAALMDQADIRSMTLSDYTKKKLFEEANPNFSDFLHQNVGEQCISRIFVNINCLIEVAFPPKF